MKITSLAKVFPLLLLSCTSFFACNSIDHTSSNRYAKLIIALNQEESDSSTIVLSLTIENILKDTLVIDGDKATFFHRQFAFELETENQTFILFPRITGAYMSKRDIIMLTKGESISFKINLLENYRSVLSEFPTENLDGFLKCYFDFEIERNSTFKSEYEIIFKSGIESNIIKI